MDVRCPSVRYLLLLQLSATFVLTVRSKRVGTAYDCGIYHLRKFEMSSSLVACMIQQSRNLFWDSGCCLCLQ